MHIAPGNNEAEKDKALFNAIADQYCKKDLKPAHIQARKVRLLQSIKNVTSTNKPNILEIGCGAGFSAEYLRGTYQSYVGLDYSEKLINFAQNHHVYPNVDFVTADISDYHPTQKFDIILMIGLLHHLEDPVSVLSKLASLLKPGGKIIANEPQSGNPLISLMRKIRKKTDESYSEDQAEYSKKELVALASDAGLTNIKITPQGILSTPFAEVALPAQWLMTPLSKLSCSIDLFLERRAAALLTYVSWNLVLEAEAPTSN